MILRWKLSGLYLDKNVKNGSQIKRAVAEYEGMRMRDLEDWVAGVLRTRVEIFRSDATAKLL